MKINKGEDKALIWRINVKFYPRVKNYSQEIQKQTEKKKGGGDKNGRENLGVKWQ